MIKEKGAPNKKKKFDVDPHSRQHFEYDFEDKKAQFILFDFEIGEKIQFCEISLKGRPIKGGQCGLSC